ncbi:MAG TPA: PqqD family protein [Bacteroidales bacterium]|nr:PqqD family protein [Bacteroidales bacterium]HPT11083.1 PqqD family protein [Bacteroidales bacterium]
MVKYIRNSKTISGRLHDEMVMMDMEQGKYFSLNQTATAIWEHLENPLTIEQLCDRLMDEYEVEREQCVEEIKEYLDEMKELSLVKEVI